MTDVSRRPADAVLGALPPLYPIIDIDLCRLRGVDPLALAAACAEGGARILQVRQKTATTGAFVQAVSAIVERLRGSGVLVLANDRPDVAVMAEADGVHVGQEDLPVDVARQIAGDRRIVGLSTHTTAQVDAGLASVADYVAVGPVFRTTTKDTGYEPRGLDLVRYAARGGKPVIAIGGITLENAREVIGAGAAAVAVISDLLACADPASRVRAYVQLDR